MLLKLSSLSIYKNVVMKAGLQGKYRQFLGGSLNWAFCEYSQSSEPWQDSAALLFPCAQIPAGQLSLWAGDAFQTPGAWAD